MEPADIDEESLQAVKSLRSKFERLASESESSSKARPSSLALTAPGSPRRRATSSSEVDTPPTDIYLRGSTSSSDLKTTLKRPPPPPPASRSSKLVVPPSPSPSSLLLRPVPVPPVSATGTRDLTALSSLKSKTDTQPSPPTSRITTPRNSMPTTGDVKPVIPPRPSSLIPQARQQIDDRTADSPIYDEEQDVNPALPRVTPPIPTRLHVDADASRKIGAQIMADSPADSDISQRSRPTSRISTPRNSFLGPGDARPTIPPRPSSLTPQVRQHINAQTNESPFSDEDQGIMQPISALPRVAPPPIPTRLQVDSDIARKFGTHTIADIPADSDISQRSIPLRPPTRHQSPISINNGDRTTQKPSSVPPSKVSSPPPALPVRRSTIATQEIAPASPLPPPLPTRSQLAAAVSGNEAALKPLRSSRLPPPPTRTIGLGDKLPPPRRPTTPSSDEDSGDEDEAKSQAIDLMPDSSTSSRRPPVLRFRDGSPEHRIHVHPQTGSMLLSGSHAVVANGHHIKVYDLAVSDVPTFTVDTKDLGLKDAKVTCMEIRPTISKVDSGSLIWVGTREGHIFEIDVRTGTARGTKYAAHLHPVAHLFRHGRSMISLDESGKTLIFSPDPADDEDITLFTTTPRVMRTTDKQDFVKVIDGKLWTAARMEHHGVGSAAQRLPVIRVYDVFNPAAPGRSLLPTDHVGAVTSAAIIPTQPRTVYVGHEEGYVSLWALDTGDGFPTCVEVIKVSVSDVLSMEGANDRLWVGGRNGMISAYNVAVRPWVVTNCWSAHAGVPVLKLAADNFAVEKVGRLCVASVGRDDNMRIWDGLLGADWVDNELVKCETAFSSFNELTVLVVSWNCDSARPDALTGENESFLTDALQSVDVAPDVIVFGLQEVIDLESRKMVAKNVILGGKKKAEDGGLSDKVTGAYKRWYDRLIMAVKAAMPKDVPYSVVQTESLVGLFSCIFVKNTERGRFDDVAITTIKRGMGGRYGNKGGIVARFVVGDSSLCFLNCHLAAGQKAVRRRNADIASMLEDRAVFVPTEHPFAYVGGGDGTMVLDHEFVILNGDLNYRIDHRREAIIASVHAGDLAPLIQHDQLLREIKFNRGCRLRGFVEGPLTFAPTYKYDPRSNEYDTSEKHRLPAWCDRVLWKSRVPARIHQLHYRRYEVNVSDHRPISAAFSITVKTFDKEARERAQVGLEKKWVEEQRRLLNLLQKFYKSQALI